MTFSGCGGYKEKPAQMIRDLDIIRITKAGIWIARFLYAPCKKTWTWSKPGNYCTLKMLHLLNILSFSALHSCIHELKQLGDQQKINHKHFSVTIVYAICQENILLVPVCHSQRFAVFFLCFICYVSQSQDYSNKDNNL